jgi:hypothetical protein
VATTSGSIYDRWLKRCHTSTEVTVTDSFTNALLAFNQGRSDALMWDDTVLVGVAAADPSAKLTNDTFLDLPYGIGIKQGNAVLPTRYYFASSVEATRWINDAWGIAVFVDAGNAFDDTKDFKVALGYGVGARVRTPIGPFRLDLAYGEESRQVRLHFSVGIAF